MLFISKEHKKQHFSLSNHLIKKDNVDHCKVETVYSARRKNAQYRNFKNNN